MPLSPIMHMGMAYVSPSTSSLSDLLGGAPLRSGPCHHDFMLPALIIPNEHFSPSVNGFRPLCFHPCFIANLNYRVLSFLDVSSLRIASPVSSSSPLFSICPQPTPLPLLSNEYHVNVVRRRLVRGVVGLTEE